MTRTTILVLAVLLLSRDATAESRFGSVMKKHIRARTVSCNTCHVKGEEKTELNAFGLVVEKSLMGKELSRRIHDAKKADAEQKKVIYEQVDKEFLAALKKLEAMKDSSGKTYGEAIRAGEIEGIKLRK